MFRCKPLWGYGIAANIRPLLVCIKPGIRLAAPQIVEALRAADATLRDAFSYNELTETLFPTARDSAVKLLVGINQLLLAAGGDSAFNFRLISPKDADQLRMLIRDLEKDLERDAEHWNSWILLDQRNLPVRMLVEAPHEIFSKQCWDSLPQLCRAEISRSTRCLAFECYTACGFHALRAVEALIREYIAKATGSLPSKRDWGHYGSELVKIEAAGNVTSITEDLRKHDRNPLMHPEIVFEMPDEAIDLLTLCKTAMARMVTDMKKRGLL